MVKKNPKTSRLEQALDETLDRFLEKVKIEEKETSKETEKTGLTLGDGNTYILPPDLEKKFKNLAKEKNLKVMGLFDEALEDFIRRADSSMDRDLIKAEFSSLQEKLENLEPGQKEGDLSPKEKKVILSYLRQLARGSWEDR